MGILHAGILEWIVMPTSRGSSQPRDGTQVSHIAGKFFTVSPPGKPKNTGVGSLFLLQGITCIAGGFFTTWTTREAQKWIYSKYIQRQQNWGLFQVKIKSFRHFLNPAPISLRFGNLLPCLCHYSACHLKFLYCCRFEDFSVFFFHECLGCENRRILQDIQKEAC